MGRENHHKPLLPSSQPFQLLPSGRCHKAVCQNCQSPVRVQETWLSHYTSNRIAHNKPYPQVIFKSRLHSLVYDFWWYKWSMSLFNIKQVSGHAFLGFTACERVCGRLHYPQPTTKLFQCFEKPLAVWRGNSFWLNVGCHDMWRVLCRESLVEPKEASMSPLPQLWINHPQSVKDHLCFIPACRMGTETLNGSAVPEFGWGATRAFWYGQPSNAIVEMQSQGSGLCHRHRIIGPKLKYWHCKAGIWSIMAQMRISCSVKHHRDVCGIF